MSVRAIVYIVLIVALLFASAFFSMTDMAYSAVSIRRLEKESRKGKKLPKMALKLAKDYDNTISTILFGNNVVNILMSSLGAALALLSPFNANSELSATIIEFAILFLLLVFGEIMPKVIGKAFSYKISKNVSYFIRGCKFVFFPFVKATMGIAHLVTRPIYKNKTIEDDVLSDEELAQMVNTIEEEGIIDEDQRELIHNSIEFVDTRAYHIVTPRVKIEGIDKATDLNTYIQKYGMFRHSRIIVYEKDLDNIVGYIPVKSLQLAMLNGKPLSVDLLMLPIISVPRTMEISSILPLIKRSHHHIVVVKDEYGGTEGILTLEDIVEELVGDLWDESEAISPDIEKTDKRCQYRVKGSMNIEEFFAHFNMDEEEIGDGYETVSGWINDQLGHFGKNGEEFEYKKLTVKIKKSANFVVEEALVTYHPRRKIN